MREFLTRFAKDQRGATAIEYGLICAMVFLVIVSAVTAFANNATGIFNAASAAIVAAH